MLCEPDANAAAPTGDKLTYAFAGMPPINSPPIGVDDESIASIALHESPLLPENATAPFATTVPAAPLVATDKNVVQLWSLVVLVVPDSVAMLIARTWWAGGDVHVTCDVLLGPIVGTIPIEREPLAMNAGSR
jgi:hypothetical protein